jgi:aspartyl-tRNA(Asn)/glutamyl-tRNA(Gln) amidotransferase subunit B
MYTGVSDCKMNEGSLRCDVNLSVRKKGTEKFGTRTEMKNLNSFSFIQKAIEYEYKRQVEAIESGESIIQETRRFDTASGKTFSMRTKENANDYRYFPDPDLPPLELTNEEIGAIGDTIPSLPDERKRIYVENFGLSSYDAELLVSEKFVADYFEKAASFTSYHKLLANLMISELMRLLPPDCESIPVSEKNMASLADMLGNGDINSSVAKKVLKELYTSDCDPYEYVKENSLGQINDDETLRFVAKEAVINNPKMVADFKS